MLTRAWSPVRSCRMFVAVKHNCTCSSSLRVLRNSPRSPETYPLAATTPRAPTAAPPPPSTAFQQIAALCRALPHLRAARSASAATDRSRPTAPDLQLAHTSRRARPADSLRAVAAAATSHSQRQDLLHLVFVVRPPHVVLHPRTQHQSLAPPLLPRRQLP